MPRIQPYQSQVAAGGVSTATIGGIVDTAVADTNPLNEIGGQLAAVYKEQQAEKAKFETEQKLTDFELEGLSRIDEINNSDLGDKTLVQAQLEDFDNRAKDIQVDPAYAEQFNLQISRMRVNLARTSIAEQSARNARAAKEGYIQSTNGLINAVRMNPNRLEDVLERGQALANATPGNEQNRVALSNAFKQDALLAHIQARLEVDPNGVKADMKGDMYKSLDPVTFNRAVGLIDAKIEANKVQQRRLVSEANTAITSIADRMERGFDIPDEEYGAVQRVVEMSGDVQTMQRMNVIDATRQNIQLMREYDPATLQNVINTQLLPATEKNGASEFEVMMLDHAEKLLTNMKEEVKRDPISYAARTGTSIKPIELDQAASIQERFSAAKSVAEKYDTDIRLFTDEELSTLKRDIEGASADGRYERIKAISTALGKDAHYAFKQLGDDDNVLAHAAGLSSMSSQHEMAARKILRGQKALEENPALRPSKTEVAYRFQKVVGDALEHLPGQEVALREAAIAHYVATSGRPKNFDDDAFDVSIRTVLGGDDKSDTGIGTHRKVNYVLPANVDEDAFDDMIKNIQPLDYETYGVNAVPPSYGNGKLATPKEIKKYGTFHSIGPGMYRVKINGRYLLGGADDGLYVLQVNEQSIQKILDK